MKITINFTVLILVIITNSCSSSSKENKLNFTDPLLQNRDTTINPANDFFQYANGGWFNHNPIPDSERSNGLWRMIGDTINAQIKQICEKAAKTSALEKNSNKQKIGDFYLSGMDTLAIERAGITPLKEAFQKIDLITDTKSLITTIAYLHTIGAKPAFLFFVEQDQKNSASHALYFLQGGLGLEDRDYYFNKDSSTMYIRSVYLKHLQAMLKLIDVDEKASLKYASVIMNLESDLARASRKLEALRDPIANYNKVSITQFNKITPNINWKSVLQVLKVPNADSVIVGQPEFFKTLNILITKYTISDWKLYLKWNLCSAYAPYLNTEIAQQNFNFYSTTLNGVTKRKPRWKRVVKHTNELLGELIAQVYVVEYLPKGTKEKLVEIGNNIRTVFADHIKNLDWMSDSTKSKALNKLEKIVMKVGYPDVWRDLSDLKIDRHVSYCTNVMQSYIWFYNYSIARYGKPVDRTEWNIYPQNYNAYYNTSNNEIVVPACNIIVPGFEGRLPDDAILYGIIGASTFGHEITHGFDDQGSQYDEHGNLYNWWTTEDRKKFVAKTKLIAKQFNNYKAAGMNINGDATQGENIADLGGVVMSYEAFKKTSQYKQNKIINGLTPAQRYFLAYAYAWMEHTRKEVQEEQIMTDVHAPEKFRVNGPLSNMPEFYKTFQVQEGNAMYIPDSLRIEIW